MATHLVEIRIDPAAVRKWGRHIGISAADDDYLIHSVFCAAYGDLRPKPFVIKPGGRSMRVLGYCPVDAGRLTEARRIGAEPEVSVCFESEMSKEMPETWRVGQRLHFELRVAPTRQKANRGGEVDAMVLAEPGQSRDEVYATWLKSRTEKACEMTVLQMTSYARCQVRRRSHTSNGDRRVLNSGFYLPDVTFKGAITVTDPEAFAELVRSGIGRHKAFGFGALLVRPAV